MKRLRWEWWIAAVLFVAFVWRFSQLTLYFLAAVALSFVGKPIVSWTASRHVGRWKLGTGIGSAVALTAMVSLATGVAMLFAPLVQEQIAALARLDAAQLTRHWNEALATLDAWTVGIDLSGEGMANSAFLAEQASGLVKFDNASSLFSGILSSVGNVFVATFSVLFMAFFLMREPALFKDLVLALTPESRQPTVTRIMERSGRLLTRYFGGLIIQVSIITLVVGLGLTLIGVPHGWLLGLLAGLFNLIPYTAEPLPWRDALVPNTPARVAEALRWFERCRARGKGNFFGAAVELMTVVARAAGHRHLSDFEVSDLTSFKRDMCDLTGVAYGGVGS